MRSEIKIKINPIQVLKYHLLGLSYFEYKNKIQQ